MKWCRFALVVLTLLAGSSCSRDPNVVKQKYVQSGNRYFDSGKYKEAALLYRRALQKDPKYGEAYYRLGLTQLKMGVARYGDAVRSLTRAVELQPKNADARIKLADVYLMAYTSQPKAEYLENVKSLKDELLKLDPKSPDGLRLDGYLVLFQEKDAQKAITRFEAASRIAPSRPEIMLPLARTLFASNQPEQGEKVARALISRVKDFGPAYDLLYANYVTGKRMADAENILKEKIRNIPKDAGSVLQLALFYFVSGRKPDMEATLSSLGSNTKDYPEGRRLAGNFYLNIRDYAHAEEQYKAGLEADPNHKLAYRNGLAQVLASQGKIEDASKIIDEVLKEDPQNAQAQGLRASLLIANPSPERVQKAIADLQPLVSKTPRNAPLRLNLARALLLKGDAGQARTQIQEAIKSDPAYVPARLMLAELQIGSGEFGSALQELNNALSVDPRNLRAKLLRSRALIGAGRLDQARENIVETIKENPTSRDAVLQMAMLEMHEKKFKNAEDLFLKLREADRRDLRALFGLSEAYAAQNQTGKAIQVLKAELAGNPSNQEIRTALANLQVRAGDYDVALPELQSLFQTNPKSVEMAMRVGETYRLKGDLKSAIDYFRKARDIRPSDVRPYIPLGILLDQTGQKAEAKSVYEQILKIQPDNPIALNNLAYLIAESGGDLDQALTFAQRARQRVPNDVNIADTLGWIYIKKSLSENAIEIFRDLVTKQPDNSTFRFHLAMALFQKGDKPQAKKELTTALQKKPSKAEEAKIRELMGKLG